MSSYFYNSSKDCSDFKFDTNYSDFLTTSYFVFDSVCAISKLFIDFHADSIFGSDPEFIAYTYDWAS